MAAPLTRRQMMAGLAASGALTATLAPTLLAAPPARADRPLGVVATTGMIADLVRTIGGEAVQVRQLMGDGVDPHLYKATRTDAAAMLEADVIFYTGLQLEGKMADAFARVASSGKPVHAVAELVDPGILIAQTEGTGKAFDPHLWMDPLGWSAAAAVVRDKLALARPASASAFKARHAAWETEAAALHAYAAAQIGSIPPARRVLVTAHDAFAYLGRRYDIEVRGIQGLSTESEAGLRQIEALVTLLVERKVPAVFAETTVSDRNVRALIEGAGARGHTVVIGGALFSDAMGPTGTYEGSYIGMIDHNVTTIARALGAAAPLKGLNGRLGS